MSKPKVAFICIHNSCRSQMAEAFGRALAGDVFESYSAGTEQRPQINQDAVRVMREHFDIDMSAQYSKLAQDIPRPDVVISMGCGVSCPAVLGPISEDWGLADPTGKDDAAFIETALAIKEKILVLKEQLQ